MSAAQAALVLDLARAGVGAEMADEPFDWLGISGISGDPGGRPGDPAGILRVAEGISGDSRGIEVIRAPVVAVPAPKPLVKVAPKPTEAADVAVWSGGAGGGIVLMVPAPAEGMDPLAGDAGILFGRMLAAIGLQDQPVGWVAAALPSERPVPACAAKLLAAMKALEPRGVLIGGQAILGSLMGRNQGVEGWQAAPKPIDGLDGLTTGVTYAPAFLLAQPMFKRMAWEHLLAWKACWGEEVGE